MPRKFKWALCGLFLVSCLAGAADEEFSDAEIKAVTQGNTATKSSNEEHELWIEKNYDPGVLDRLLFDYYGKFALSSDIKLGVAVALDPFEQVEPELIGGDLTFAIEKIASTLTFAFQQERWHSWQVTENRAEVYLNVRLFSNLFFAFGMGYRAPQFNVTSLWQSLNPLSDNYELNVIYRLQWNIVDNASFTLPLIINNYDRMRLYTFTDVHFALAPAYRLDSRLSIQAYAAVGVKGASGVVLSFSQTTFGAGLKYEL